MRPTVAMLAALTMYSACAPPDPISLVDTGADPTGANGEPSLRILFPELDPGDGRLHLEITPDCAIEQLFVFDVDNFDIVESGSGDNSDTEGHIHISLSGDYETAELGPTVVFERSNVSPSSPVVPASFGVARATLQNNDHTDLDQFEGWEHELEYVVDDPSGNCL